MFVPLLRRAFAPRNLAVTAAASLTIVGIASAAIGSAQIKNGSLTGADIKNGGIASIDVANNSLTSTDIKAGTIASSDVKDRALKGRDVRDNAIKGRQVDEGTLGKVPAAIAADTAAAATSATLADKAKGTTRFSTGFVAISADDNDPTVARAAASLITLAEAGTLKLQAACFRDTDADRVYSEVYATTTANGAILDGWWDRLPGGATFNSTTFLNTDTLLTDRQVFDDFSTSDTFEFPGSWNGQVPFSLLGADGSYMTGGMQVMTRNGTPTGATGLPGAEHSCAFFGEITHSGNA